MENIIQTDLLNIVIFYVNILKKPITSYDDYTINKEGSKYLLGQTLRQLHLPKERYYVSIAANELWNKLTSENIFDSFYINNVKVDKVNEEFVGQYKGASGLPYKTEIVKNGENFEYRAVFHDDHIIPITVIIDELIKIENLNHDSVRDIINKIGVCKMLKSEDRKIKEKKKRPFDENKVIEIIYKKYGINLLNYNYFKETIN